MTTQRRYACNLCRETIQDDTRGRGLWFAPLGKIELRAIAAAENHICETCLRALDNALSVAARTAPVSTSPGG